MENNSIVFYQFGRERVERGDFNHFLKLYDPQNFPRGRRLREMMNSVAFAIEGYDDDPREIHAIPEIRSFYSALRAAFPWWLYFANLEIETLQILVACNLPSMGTMTDKSRPHTLVAFPPDALLKFLQDNYAPMLSLCRRAEMFDHLIAERRAAILSAFKLPLDSPLQ